MAALYAFPSGRVPLFGEQRVVAALMQKPPSILGRMDSD